MMGANDMAKAKVEIVQVKEEEKFRRLMLELNNEYAESQQEITSTQQEIIQGYKNYEIQHLNLNFHKENCKVSFWGMPDKENKDKTLSVGEIPNESNIKIKSHKHSRYYAFGHGADSSGEGA